MSDFDAQLQGAMGQPFTLNTGETSRVRVARGVKVEWLEISGQVSARCVHLNTPNLKPVLAVRYSREDSVFLAVDPVTSDANFSLVRIELIQHHADGTTTATSTLPRQPVIGGPLSAVYKMGDLVDNLNAGVNQLIVEAKVVLKSGTGETEVFSLNTLHLVRQYVVVFLPGVAGAEIEVASHPGEFSYAAWSAAFVPGTDEFRRLSCSNVGNPNPGAQATRTELLESFAKQTVYDVRDRRELNTPAGHPTLRFLQGGRATGPALLYYKVVPWAYDWRLRLEFAVDWLLGNTPHPPAVGARMPSLKEILAEQKQTLPFLADKAVLAGHSTGGVVMRGLLSKPESASLVEHAFFCNVPFFGAPKAYFVYLTGAILPFIADSLMKEMAPHFPIVYYLAPTERYPDQVARTGDTPVRRSVGQNVGNAIIKPLIIRMGLSYPATINRWSDFLEQRAREYHASITTPVIGWDNCTVYWGRTTSPETPGPVFVPFIGRDPQRDDIVGDGTVPEVSLKGDSPSNRQIELPGNIEHVPAPNNTMVWLNIAHTLSNLR